jgi:hypothetical protein
MRVGTCARESRTESIQYLPSLSLNFCLFLEQIILLQVSKIRPSDSDYRKFYVDTGTVELRLKADTKYDPSALQFSNAVQSLWISPEGVHRSK